MITFGKYSGKRLADIDTGYIAWASENLKGENKNLFYAEKVRRWFNAGIHRQISKLAKLWSAQ